MSVSNNETRTKNRLISGGVTFQITFKVLLAAPTGKAAIRMLDSIRDAQTGLSLSEEVAALNAQRSQHHS